MWLDWEEGRGCVSPCWAYGKRGSELEGRGRSDPDHPPWSLIPHVHLGQIDRPIFTLQKDLKPSLKLFSVCPQNGFFLGKKWTLRFFSQHFRTPFLGHFCLLSSVSVPDLWIKLTAGIKRYVCVCFFKGVRGKVFSPWAPYVEWEGRLNV